MMRNLNKFTNNENYYYVTCPSCNAKLKANKKVITHTKSVKCPKCSSVFSFKETRDAEDVSSDIQSKVDQDKIDQKISLHKNYDKNTKEPEGIGGWLILVTIGLFISPIRILIMVYDAFLPIFQQGIWDSITTPSSEYYNPLFATLLLCELAGNAIFIIFPCFLIYFLFTKSYRFPKLVIIYLISNVLFVVGDYFIANLMFGLEDDPDSVSDIARALISCAIWIPYMLVSKRVKNTFVKPESNTSF